MELTDLEKADLLLQNRRISLKDVAKFSKIPYGTIKQYSSKPEMLRNTAWWKVRELSLIYDKFKSTSKNER